MVGIAGIYSIVGDSGVSMRASGPRSQGRTADGTLRRWVFAVALLRLATRWGSIPAAGYRIPLRVTAG